MPITQLLLSLIVAADPQIHAVEIESPAHRVPLVELFSSEGCSSCPGAERAISELGSRDRALTRLVPLAFHVTYWDYIGWQDRFGSKQFDDRQRSYAAAAESETVYTPQWVVDGKDSRARGSSIDKLLAELSKKPAAVTIQLRAEWNASSRRLVVAANATRRKDDLDVSELGLQLAVYERHLQTKVKRGENGGRVLRHDFVVRELTRPKVWHSNSAAVTQEQTFEIPGDWRASELGVAAIVQHRDSLEVLQSVAVSLVE